MPTKVDASELVLECREGEDPEEEVEGQHKL